MANPLVTVEALYCERDERVLFSALSFTVAPGTAVQLRGPNGAGKTTLLRILAGLHRDYEGRVACPREALAYLGHRPALSGVLTAAQNLAHYLSLTAQGTPLAAISDALAEVGLAGFEDVPCQALSAGQQRRVSLARLPLLGDRAALWLLDEPFTALDDEGIALVSGLMAKQQARGGAVVFTTHQPLAPAPGLHTLWLGAPDPAAPAVALAHG